jgi:hypothetical protein
LLKKFVPSLKVAAIITKSPKSYYDNEPTILYLYNMKSSAITKYIDINKCYMIKEKI